MFLIIFLVDALVKHHCVKFVVYSSVKLFIFPLVFFFSFAGSLHDTEDL